MMTLSCILGRQRQLGMDLEPIWFLELALINSHVNLVVKSATGTNEFLSSEDARVNVNAQWAVK